MDGKESLITSNDARRLLQIVGCEKIELSLDLNLSQVEVVISPEGLTLPSGLLVTRPQLEEIARKRKRIYLLEQDGPNPLEIAGSHYYKLTPTDGAPTIEIDGIQMHRTSSVEPFEDSHQKVQDTVRAGDDVLDTCGGLGYTAIWSKRTGASRIVSVEICPEVRELRAKNPWSHELFQAPIETAEADVLEYIKSLPPESFNAIIHDPPRFSLAGELYGSAFYSHLFRVLRPGGQLFHYTGTPYSRRGSRDFPGEIVRRLKETGFRSRREPHKLGVSARK